MIVDSSTVSIEEAFSPRVASSRLRDDRKSQREAKVSKLAFESIDTCDKSATFQIRSRSGTRKQQRKGTPPFRDRSLLSISQSRRLTLESMFLKGQISGATIYNIKFSPDSSQLLFLDTKERGKVFLHDIVDDQTTVVFDTEQLPVLETIDVDDIFWMPCNEEMIVLQDKGVYIVNLFEEDYPFKVISLSENKKQQMTLSPSGKQLAYLRSHNIYMIDVGTGVEEKITNDGKKTKKNGFAEYAAWMDLDRETGYWWSPEGQHIAYIQTEERGVKAYQVPGTGDKASETVKMHLPFAGEANATVNLRVVNIETGEDIALDIGEDPDIYIARVDWLPDGKKLAVQRLSRDQKKLDLIFYDIKTKKSERILSESSDTWVNYHDDLYFLKNNKFFIWSSERSGFKHLYLYEINGKQLKQLTAGEWVVKRLVGVDEMTGTVYFEGYAQSPIEKHLYQTSIPNENPHLVTKVTGGAGSHSILFSPDCTYVIDTFSKVHLPPSISVCNVRDMERCHWVQRNKADYKHPFYSVLSHYVAPKFGSFKTADGVDLIYSLIRPANFDRKKQYPVITMVYGGPHLRIVKNEWSDATIFRITQYMVNRGYVIFSVDNRGSSERGKAFEEPIQGKMGCIEVQDQKAGIEMLKKKYSWVEPERVGIMGHSYGGYMTLMALMKEPDTFKAGYAGAPWVDPKEYNACYTERYLGDPKQNPDGYKESDVLTHAHKLKRPLLLAGGLSDDNVLYAKHSARLIERLQEYRIPFEMTVLPGEKHGFSSPNKTLHVYKKVVDFFDRQFFPKREALR